MLRLDVVRPNMTITETLVYSPENVAATIHTGKKKKKETRKTDAKRKMFNAPPVALVIPTSP